MKKVAIISDTHNVLRPQVLDICGSCDAIFHAGDFTRDEILDELRHLSRVYVVRGNNDVIWAHHLRDKLKFEYAGLNFFMTHEQRYVDRNLEGVDVVVFGHSHKYFESDIGGRLWLNPGSCGRPRFGGECSMVVMYIAESEAEMFDCENGDKQLYRIEKITF